MARYASQTTVSPEKSGKTVGQHVVPWIERAYAAGKVPQLMAWSGDAE